MDGAPEKKISSSIAEFVYLCAHIKKAEDAYRAMNGEFDDADAFTIRKKVIQEYAEYDPSVILTREYTITEHDLKQALAVLHTSHDHTHDIAHFLSSHGVKNTLTILREHFKASYERRQHKKFYDQVVRSVTCDGG